MTERERWEEIADEVGTYDLEYVGYAYVGGDELVRQEPPAVGQWMQAEEACKRLAAKERELAEARREAAQLRRIAVDAVNETDGWCREDVSIGFLCGLANEVAGVKKQRDEARARVGELEALVAEIESRVAVIFTALGGGEGNDG